jgi:hypothetical protein
MRADCDFTYALGTEWRSCEGKTKARTQSFNPISSKLNNLHVMFANLRGLRQRCDEPRAKSRHRHSQPKRHAAASGFYRGGRMAKGQVSGVNACREIAGKFPHRSHTPVMFGWACV